MTSRNKILAGILLITYSFLSSAFGRGREFYHHTTPDDQFVVIAQEDVQDISDIAQNLKIQILEHLNIFFLWEKPAEIVIHAQKKWEKEYTYYFYNIQSKKEKRRGIQTFYQKALAEKVIFPALTSLILSEIIQREKNIPQIEGNSLKIPLCLITGLWRKIANYSTLERLEKIDSVRLSQLVHIRQYPKKSEMFAILSTSLIEFLFSLP